MNLLVNNPRIETFEGMNFGNENENIGLRFELTDISNPYMRPVKQVIFYNQAPGLLQRWAEVLPTSRGGNLPDSEEHPWSINDVPRDLRVFLNAEFVEYDFGGDYVSRYSRDIEDKDGNIIHEKGEIVVDRAGVPRITRKKMILCQFQYVFEDVLDDYGFPIFDENNRTKRKIVRDENGNAKRQWTSGFDPVTVGESLKRMYEAYQGEVPASSGIPTDDDGADFGEGDDDENTTTPPPAQQQHQPGVRVPGAVRH